MIGMTGKTAHNNAVTQRKQIASAVSSLRNKADMLTARRNASPSKDFNIVFCGVFSSGKTSLINALLNLNLPTGIVPVTKIITQIKYGSRYRVLLEKKGEASSEIDYNYACDIIAGKIRFPRDEISKIIIEIPSKLLQSGISFFDTPGIEDSEKGIDDVTKAALKEANLAVMCFNPTVLMDMTEAEFLKTLQQLTGGNCAFVINCMNYINTAEQLRDIEERADNVFKNYGNPSTVGKGTYFEVCSIPEYLNLNGFDKWLEALITYKAEQIKRISSQSLYKFKANDLCDEIKLEISKLESELKRIKQENLKKKTDRQKRIDIKIDEIREIQKKQSTNTLEQTVNGEIDKIGCYNFVSIAEEAINKRSKEYIVNFFGALRRNSFKPEDYNVDENRYKIMAAATAKKVNVAKPISTRHTKSWSDRIFEGIDNALSGFNPIEFDSKYYYTYNDYKSAAKQRFRLFGIPAVNQLTETIVNQYIKYLEGEKNSVIEESGEEADYLQNSIKSLQKLQNDLKIKFSIT